jgi:hypothetical protein
MNAYAACLPGPQVSFTYGDTAVGTPFFARPTFESLSTHQRWVMVPAEELAVVEQVEDFLLGALAERILDDSTPADFIPYEQVRGSLGLD